MWKFYTVSKENQALFPKGRHLTRKLTTEIIDQIDHSLKKQEILSQGIKKSNNQESHINHLIAIKMMLVRTKKKIDDAMIQQKLLADPLINNQPSFFFSQKQPSNRKQERVNFNSYLSGELSLSDYIQIKNFERLYNQIRTDPIGKTLTKENEQNNSFQTILQKLKKKIIDKQKYQPKSADRQNILELINNQEQKKIEQQRIPKDPKAQLAKKIHEYIIQQHDKSNISAYQQDKLQFFNYIIIFSNKSLRDIKLMNELSSINEAFVDKIENKDLLCTAFSTQYYLKSNPKYVKGNSMIIMKNKRLELDILPKNQNIKLIKKDFSQELKSKVSAFIQKNQSQSVFVKGSGQYRSVLVRKKSEKVIQKISNAATSPLSLQKGISRMKTEETIATRRIPTNFKENQISKEKQIKLKNFFPNQIKQFKETDNQLHIYDEFSEESNQKEQKNTRKLNKIKYQNKNLENDNQNLLHSVNCSQDSSFQSLFEIGIDSLYNQTIQLEQQILNKKSETFVKRIKQLQRINQLTLQTVKANFQKLNSVD